MQTNEDFILDIGSKINRLRVVLGSFEGRATIDIRKWFQDKQTHEFKRSSKGITLTSDYFHSLIGCLDEHRNKIEGHFGANQKDFSPIAKSVEAKREIDPLEFEFDVTQVPLLSWRHEGSRLVAVVNSAHPISRLVNENSQIKSLLESFVRAASTIDPDASYTGAEMLSLLIETWSIFSKSQLNRENPK